MESTKMDMALDDIIGKRGRGGRRGGRGGAFRRSSNNRGGFQRNSSPYNRPRRSERMNVDGEWKHDLYQQLEQEEERPSFRRNNGRGAQSSQGSAKIRINNLAFSATEDDVFDFFSQVGNVRKVIIHYDQSGRAQGSGEVILSSRSEALDAINSLEGAQIAGRSVSLELVRSPSSAPVRRGGRVSRGGGLGGGLGRGFKRGNRRGGFRSGGLRSGGGSIFRSRRGNSDAGRRDEHDDRV